MDGPARPAETSLPRDMVKGVALVAVCLLLVAAGWYGVTTEPEGFRARRFRQGAFVILPLFALLTPLAVLRLIRPLGAPVRIDGRGIHDRRAGRRPVPWAEVTNVVRRGGDVVLTLRRGFAREYPFTLAQRLLKRRRRSTGPSHLVVASWGLRAGPQDILAAIEAHRPASAERLTSRDVHGENDAVPET